MTSCSDKVPNISHKCPEPPQPKKKIISKPLMMPGKKFSDHIRRYLK